MKGVKLMEKSVAKPTSFSINSDEYSKYIKELAIEEMKGIIFKNSEINTAIGLLLHKVDKNIIDEITKEYVKNVRQIHILQDIVSTSNLYNSDPSTFLLLMNNKLRELQKTLNQLSITKDSEKYIAEIKEQVETIGAIITNFNKGRD